MSYTRWGKLTCPPGTELAYDGAIVGSKYNEGGSSEFLCLHNQPDFLPIVPGSQDERSRMFGTELRNHVGHHEKVPALSHLIDHEISCSVCYASSRSAVITVPGRKTCPQSWTREYYGYMVADKHATHHRLRAPICLDAEAEAAYGSTPGSLATSFFYFMETTCSGIRCPPYVDGAELACAVCTK